VTINWAQCHTRPVLMIPGPTELPFPVIQAMNQPPTIQYDRSFDEEVLEPVTRMRDQYGILIGTGLDKMRSSTLRIGTMAMTASPHYVLPTLSALELALRDLGYKCEPGAGVAAAQAAFADAG